MTFIEYIQNEAKNQVNLEYIVECHKKASVVRDAIYRYDIAYDTNEYIDWTDLWEYISALEQSVVNALVMTKEEKSN